MELFRHWSEVVDLSENLPGNPGRPLDRSQFGSPVPRPGAIYGLVANYPPASRPDPPVPMVFGKFPSAVCGPYDDICLPQAESLPMKAEWTVPEAELAVVIAAGGRRIRAEAALDRVAGFTIAQDITERVHEFWPSWDFRGDDGLCIPQGDGKELRHLLPAWTRGGHVG
jgi:2-keto-4-pentenoate hydratase/2-oxohepta-3-ene-1,7-dioic acid hydratase in catechol pathway